MRRLSVLVLGSLVFAVGACSLPIHHGLDEPAANEMMTALERAGIGAEKMREEGANSAGFVVKVASGDATRAMELLRSMGLPRERHAGFAETYGQPSLVPSATEEKARFLQALSSEIGRTLETVDSVVNARVHLVPAETDPLDTSGKPRVPAQAAVLLKVRAGAPPIKEADVQRLVAGSVPGLQPGAVAVVVTSAPDSLSGIAPALAALGPLRVSPSSRPMLLGVLAVALLAVAVLAGLLLVTARRLSGLQRERERAA